jgi:hypothetical protein
MLPCLNHRAERGKISSPVRHVAGIYNGIVAAYPLVIASGEVVATKDGEEGWANYKTVLEPYLRC